jgi:hypothetical protein
MTAEVPKIICLNCGTDMSSIEPPRFSSLNLQEYECACCGRTEIVDLKELNSKHQGRKPKLNDLELS